MLYAGLDLSRQRLDVHVLDEEGQTVEVTAVRPDADALRTLAARVQRSGQEVTAAIESMTGARFVHDTLERYGWDVAIADSVKAKGLAPLAAKTDKIDARVLAELARRDLVPEIWLPDPTRPCRARAGPLPPAPGAPSHRTQEPHPRHAHDLRPPSLGHGSLRRGWSGTLGAAGHSGTVGDHAHHEPADGRRARPADRRLCGGTPRPWAPITP